MDEFREYWGTKLVEAAPRAKDGKDGYAVRYADGYESWSPKDVFEAAYQPTNAMSFGHALMVLKNGGNVCRAGWNGKGQYLGLQIPDSHSANTLPYVWIMTVDGKRVPWLASQTDMLANDWERRIVFPT